MMKAAVLAGLAVAAIAGPVLTSAPASAAGTASRAPERGAVLSAARAVTTATRPVTSARAAKTGSIAAVPGSQVWVARFAGQNSGAEATAMELSPDGSVVFVSGWSNAIAAGHDFTTVAYDSATGTQLWSADYNGPASQNDIVHAMGVSPDGQTVFVTGESMGSSPAVNGYLTVAYNAATGTQLWVKRYIGPDKNGGVATALAVSPSGGAVIVTGTTYGTTTGDDYATIAYNPATGAQLWARRYNGPNALYNNDQATAVAVSPDGSEVFVTGTSLFLAGTNDPLYAYTTIAYNAATGTQVWNRRYEKFEPGNATASALTVSPDGRTVFVTGTRGDSSPYTDYATVAYRAGTGAELWVALYNGPDGLNDAATSLAVSPDGTAVYVTGRSVGAATFDDYATVAYNAATGAQLWAARYNGPPNEPDEAKAVGVSPDGKTVYVTGLAGGPVLTGGYQIEYTTIAYNAATGASRWIRRYPGVNNVLGGAACCIAISPQTGLVYVAGYANTKTGFEDMATVAYDG